MVEDVPTVPLPPHTIDKTYFRPGDREIQEHPVSGIAVCRPENRRKVAYHGSPISR